MAFDESRRVLEHHTPDRSPLESRAAGDSRPPSAIPSDVQGQQMRLSRGSARVIDRGSGPAIVLVHGMGATAASFTPIIDALAERHRVIAVDLFGMGFSERNRSFRYGWPLWADQIASLLDALEIEQADVVGHSLGGTVAITLADRHPERVRRVVLAGSASTMPWYFFVMLIPGLGEAYLATLDFLGVAYDAKHRAELEAAYRVPGSRSALLRYTRRMALDVLRFSRAVDRLAVPVLQLHGRCDDEVPLKAAERLHVRLRNSRLVPIEGAQHYIMRDAPRRFTTEVLRFLSA